MPQTKPTEHGEGLQPKSKPYGATKRSEAGETPRSDVKSKEPAKQSGEYLRGKTRSPTIPTSGKGRPPKVPSYRMSNEKNRYHGRG